MEVTFGGAVARQPQAAQRRPTRPSPSDQEDNEHGHGGGGGRGTSGDGANGSGGGYDSDDLYDASMAAGGVLPSALSAGGNTNKGRTNDGGGLPHDRAEIDAAKRRRRKKLADSEFANRADEIQRLEEEDDDDHDGSGGGRGSSKMGSTGGNAPGSQGGGEFRGEEDLDAGLSLISSSSAADPSTAFSANPADPNAISGAYDAGSNAACPVEPFNLKAEREGGEGYFDGDTYVFRRLEEGGRAMDEEPDAWLDELGGRDANDGQAGGGTGGIARLSNAKTTKKKQPTLDLDDVSHEELCSRIAALLAGDKETVARGLKRYGDVIARDRKRRQKLAKKRRRGAGNKDGGEEAGEDGMDAQGKTTDEDDGAGGVAAAQRALSDLTDLADAVLMGGDGEVYSRTKEELVRMSSVADTNVEEDHLAGHKRKRNYFGGAGGDANDDDKGDGSTSKMAKVAGGAPVQADKKAPVQWEYRGNQDQQIHGPYTTEQMLGWIQAGYFVGEAAVDVRRVASANGVGGGAGNDAAAKKAAETATADDLMADLMDSDDDEGGEAAKVETDAANEWQRSDKVDFNSYLC